MKKFVSLVVVLVVVALGVFVYNSFNNNKSIDNASFESIMLGDQGIKYAFDVETLLAGSLQERENWSIWNNDAAYNVYQPSTDSIVYDANGQEYNLDYGFDVIDENIYILRDGYTVMAKVDEKTFVRHVDSKKFATAEDSKFAGKVYCENHKSFCSFMNVGYPTSQEFKGNGCNGYHGPFKTELVSKTFKSWIIVEREFKTDLGGTCRAYVWAVRVCDCNNYVPDGCHTPAHNPTVQPTAQPTAQPTTQPTTQPTVKPTPSHNPTPVPTSQPTTQPTVKPTPSHNPTPKPTAQSTVKPTPSHNPTPKPIATDPAPVHNPLNPTKAPSHSPVNSPVDGGLSEYDRPGDDGVNW